ncbi:MAG TPA: hypothetical protein VF766_06405 [Pyrinomonadaceae bacterium]
MSDLTTAASDANGCMASIAGIITQTQCRLKVLAYEELGLCDDASMLPQQAQHERVMERLRSRHRETARSV